MRACVLLLLAGLAASPVLAQGRRKKPVFNEDEIERQTPVEAEPDRRRTALQNTLARLAGWPRERSRRAAERLIVQKEKSLSLVLDVLVSLDKEDESLKPGAAYVLGRIGEKSHFLTLVLTAAEKKQQRHARTFLEAAYLLHPEGAVVESFRFFHLSETTLRHEATKFVRSHITRENLDAVLELIDPRKSARSFTREIGLVLLDRLVAKGEVKWIETVEDEGAPRRGAGAVFYRALGDGSPQVAARAMRLVASRSDKANIRELNHLITREFSNWRQRSYSTLALSIIASAFKLQPFTPESIEVLTGEKGIHHRKDMLVQASSALGLAHVALRTGDEDLVRLLDRQIPIVLIEAVGAGNRHYRDFGSVVDLAYIMLRRITGKDFPDQAPLWAEWWRDHGRRFRARRELLRVEETDFADVVLDATPPRSINAEPVRISVVGSMRPTFLHGQAFALREERMREVVGQLTAYGFFEAPEIDLHHVPDDALVVTVRVGDLNRTVAFGAGEDEITRRDEFFTLLRNLVVANAWQLWQDLDEQPSWELFFAENSRWFAGNTDLEERRARLRAMVAGALDDAIDADVRLYAARFIGRMEGAGGALRSPEVSAFIRAVELEPEVNEFCAETVNLLVPAAGESAARGLVDALAGKIGPRAHMLLVQLCESLPPKEVGGMTSDSRWKVRRAAVTAIARRDPQLARPVLLARLSDEEVLVRIVAAEELARMKDPSILPALAALKDDRSADVRAASAYAYGLLASERGREGVAELLYDDPSPRVRVRAVEGLVEGGDPEALDLLIGVFSVDTELRVRAAAARGIVALESPSVIDTLMQRMELTGANSPERVALVNVLSRFHSNRPVSLLRMVLQGDDSASADAAALGLARRWDETSISQLIRMVERGRNARAAVRHLQLLTSIAFEAEDYERQAQNYKAWYANSSTGNPRLWFRDALGKGGYEVSDVDAWAETKGVSIPAVPDEMIPLLLRVLRAKEVFLISNASLLLNRAMADAGAVPPDRITHISTEKTAEAAIQVYVDWWTDRQAAEEALERG